MLFSRGIQMKNINILALLCLLPPYILSISSSITLDGQPIHTCNELLEAMVNQKDRVATAIQELFSDSSIIKNTPTQAKKQAVIAKMNSKDPQFNPCQLLQDTIQQQRTGFLPHLLAQIDLHYKDQETAARFKAPVEALMNDNQLTQEWTLVLPSHFNEVGPEESISYEKLTSLVTAQVVRGLELINKELQRNYQEKPLLNALYAQEMLRTMTNATVWISLQRWCEYNLSEQQWQTLLDTQYVAFARVVPSVCAIIDMFNQPQQNTIAA